MQSSTRPPRLIGEPRCLAVLIRPHVASTKQIGGIDVVKVENQGKANRRLRIRITD